MPFEPYTIFLGFDGRFRDLEPQRRVKQFGAEPLALGRDLDITP